MTGDARVPPLAPGAEADTPSGEPPAPEGVDASKPSPARMYDYFLGGTTNYPSDRVVGEQVRRSIPEVVDAAWANRAFHQRAARWLAGLGVRQFVDIGSGLPTAGNTHQIVQAVASAARVLYIDIDPLGLAHSRDLLAGSTTTRAVMADMRDPGTLLGHPRLREFIDFSQPVGLLMTAVVHFIAPELDPWRLVARYVAALPTGSYLVLSHVTDEKTPPSLVRLAEEMYSRSTENIYFRSRADVARFFEGLDLVSPCRGQDADVVHPGEWGADDPADADSDGSRWLYCGVGRRH